MLLCIKCSKNETVNDPITGQSPYCQSCQDSLSAVHSRIPEFVGEDIIEDRKKHAADIEQPHRKGELNKEWLDGKYGGVERARKMGFTEKEIKQAKYVYSGDNTYYKKHT